jgi:hypothetical protein
MIDSIAEEIVNFLMARGGFAEHQDMPHHQRTDFDPAIEYLAANGILVKRVSAFDGLTTYRLID